MIRLFIGYDKREHVDWHVLTQSIIDQVRYPVSITPLALRHLPMWRHRLQHQSTEFSISRFLVPFLCGYQGIGIFMDSDMVVKNGDLFLLASQSMASHHAVSVVQHDYTPLRSDKFLGYKQTIYPRKNWSSFMCFNAGHPACLKLTPELVNHAEAGYLHQLRWCAESEIGKLPPGFNVLVDEPDSDPQQAIMQYNIHYTRGSPMHPETVDTNQAGDWLSIYRSFALPHIGVINGDVRSNEKPDSSGGESH